MEPMKVPLPHYFPPVRNTFIQFDNLPWPLLEKSTTAPPGYPQLPRTASRTISTQTQSSVSSTPNDGRINDSFFTTQLSMSFYSKGNHSEKSEKSETDSTGSAFEDDTSPDEEEQSVQEGQLRYTKDESGVIWVPESKRFGKHSAEHQVVSSRFELNVCGQSVGFLLMIRPAKTQNRKGVLRAAFKNTQQRQIQLKCLDEVESLFKIPVQVTFTVGSEQRRLTYDFQSPICELPGGQGLWDLPAPKRGEKPIVIKVNISAAPSRW
eukprot:gnl/MRDRNA2_/MRDRNA2_94860_c0_seq1.p1 gnl/MRDRNA2_/MRDRNA2_94860_c0~~gnl/MRDRNA2_/MRDRNA2_94860_c0_seq1.p1  ORF type:complete len:296 (-),score=49.72 gnl/MRDRNA2_/MRDRNA2_94860_c0_seq1:159-953(-)